MRLTKLESFEERFASLTLWEHNEKHKFDLLEFAKAGFFFDHTFDLHDDPGRLRCAFCPAVIGNWEPSDDPWKEHILSVNHCPHVVRYKGEDFVDKVNEETVDTETRVNDEDVAQLFEQCGHFGLSGLHSCQLMSREQRATNNDESRRKLFNLDMYALKARLASFDSVHPNSISRNLINQITDAGFYFEASDGRGVKVRCFCCGLAVCQINEEDDLWRLHAQMSDCDHVKRRKGIEFISQARNECATGKDEEMDDIIPEPAMNSQKQTEQVKPETKNGEMNELYDRRMMGVGRGVTQNTYLRKSIVPDTTKSQYNSSDGDHDWGEGRNVAETVFLCCRYVVFRSKDGRGPCPVCLLDT